MPAELGRRWPLVRAVLAAVMLVGLTLVGPVLAQDDPTVSFADQDVSRGETFTVMVEVRDAVDVAGYSLELTFDPDVVEVQSVEVGDFLGVSPFFTGTDFDNAAGTILAEASLEPPFAGGGVTGDGVLAEIELEAVGWGHSGLAFDMVELYDSDALPLDVDLDAGDVVSLAAMEVSPAHPEELVPLGPFTEQILIKGAADLAGYQFTLRSSNPDVVAITDVELGPFLEANSELEATTNKSVAADEATFEVAGTPPGADPVDGADGDGVIAIVHLDALMPGQSALTLHDRTVYDTDADTEEPEAMNGLVYVTDLEMSVQPAETTVAPNEVFDIDIHIDEDADDLSSYQFTLDWDPAVVTVTNVADTGFLGGAATTNLTKDAVVGTLTFEAVLLPPTEPVSARPEGPGDLATVTFQALAEGTSALDLEDAVVFEGDTEMPAIPVDGMVTVELFRLYLPFVSKDFAQ